MPRSPDTALLLFFFWEGSPTKIDDRKKGTPILTSLLEDLVAAKNLLEHKYPEVGGLQNRPSTWTIEPFGAQISQK